VRRKSASRVIAVRSIQICLNRQAKSGIQRARTVAQSRIFRPLREKTDPGDFNDLEIQICGDSNDRPYCFRGQMGTFEHRAMASLEPGGHGAPTDRSSSCAQRA
jgi:hypothetical protein